MDTKRDTLRAKWTEIVTEFSGSGQNAKDFCQERGIGYKTFLRWCDRLAFDVRKRGWKRGRHPASRMQLSPQAPSTHGVYSFIKTGLVPCNACIWRDECERYEADKSCKVLAEFQSIKMQELMSLDHVKSEDAPMVEMAVREMAIQALIMRYTSRIGLFRTTKDGGQGLQPVMNQYWCSVNSLSRILTKLGLEPTARKQLGIGTGPEAFNLAQAILDAKEK